MGCPQADHLADLVEPDQISRPEHRHRISSLEIGGLLIQLNPISDRERRRFVDHGSHKRWLPDLTCCRMAVIA